MSPALSVARRQMYTPAGVGGGGGLPNTNYGACLNDWFGAGKTTGGGGDYVNGRVAIPGGTYYWNPITDAAAGGYTRAYNAGKPNGNWLEAYEFDGPGTVTINLLPDSAAVALGQSQTAAYNDTAHGGGFHVSGGGSLRWCFNGAFNWTGGSIRTEAGGAGVVDRITWYNTSHSYSNADFYTQVAVLSNIMGYGTPPNPIPQGAPWDTVLADLRLKGNWDAATFRFHSGITRGRILRSLIDQATDDGVFVGGGSDYVDVIGVGMSRVDNGGNRTTNFHSDDVQVTGTLGHGRVLDCTLEGHALEIYAEASQGNIQNLTIDRCWQGHCGIDGGDIGADTGRSVTNTCQVGTGAPTTRVGSAHFYKGFSNGIQHRDGDPQITIDPYIANWHAVIENGYGGNNASMSVTVAVPTGVTVDADGFMTSSLSSFMNSTDVPHQVFRAAYSSTDLAAVMSDYSIAYD